MKKITTILVGLLLCTSVLPAQNISTVIKTEALKMAKALAALDLDTYASFTYPTLLEEKGSKEKIKQGVDSVEKYRKDFGLKVKSIIIGNPSEVVTHNGIMQCTIPQTINIEIMMGSMEAESTLIGLSKDGKTWYFVDAMLYKQKDAKAKLPELSPKLVIPASKQPLIKSNDAPKN